MDWLKLNTNESPLPPSPTVARAIAAAAEDLRLYPHPFGEPLRSALAAHHGVEPAAIFVANGGDQVLDCCYRAFVEPGDAVVHPTPTYSLFPVLSRMFAVSDVAVPLQNGALSPDFTTRPAPLRFVVNPNSPTGHWIPPESLERQLAGASGVVVIDEAYVDFAPASCAPHVGRHDNWVVLRSFSKAHALAGLRVGYALGSAAVIEDLEAVKDSYPVDRCAVAGAVAALEDEEHHRLIVETVRAQRDRLTAGLRELGWTVQPSQANFVYARPGSGRAATDVARRLRAQRILVRCFDGPQTHDHVRITVGDAAATDRVLAALTDMQA